MIVATGAKRRSRQRKLAAAVISNNDQTCQGEIMKKQYLRILMALVGFAAFAMAAHAQAVDQIVVTIPYEFVAAGKTLPAGTYRVNRISGDRFAGLVFSSFENRASVIVHPIEVESADGQNVHVAFRQIEGQYFLSKIETADNVFNIPVPRSAILLASTKSHNGVSASASSGSN
jgi:hypothetical protein